jgi:hypothetical protein
VSRSRSPRAPPAPSTLAIGERTSGTLFRAADGKRFDGHGAADRPPCDPPRRDQRVTYWCTSDGTIVLLTVFRKTRQHEQRQIDRAVRAQKTCERDHRGPATETYERQV